MCSYWALIFNFVANEHRHTFKKFIGYLAIGIDAMGALDRPSSLGHCNSASAANNSLQLPFKGSPLADGSHLTL